MTVLIFISCSLLVFGPIFVISKASILNQVKYKNYFLFGFIGHLVWEISKILLLGSIYPFYDLEIYDPVQEFIKIIGKLIEVVIIYYSLGYLFKEKLNSNLIKHKIIILAYTLGWYTIGSLIYQLIPLVNTLGVEFNWVYTYSAIESNIKLLELLALNTCIYLYIINHSNQFLLNKSKLESASTSANRNNNNHFNSQNNSYQYQLKQSHQSKNLLNILLISYMLFQAFSSYISHKIPHHGLLILKSLYSSLFYKCVMF